MKNEAISTEWIDEVDAPELTEEFFEQARFLINGVEYPNPYRAKGRPKAETPKKAINIRLSQDVLEKFRATGKGWQTRVDVALKEWLIQQEQRA